jgi:lipoic acid synthetase
LTVKTNANINCTELRNIDVDVVTFGQYMRPTKRHMKVEEYVSPEKFELWRQRALDMGFLIKKRAKKNQLAMAEDAGDFKPLNAA